ncbi:hypothetical protein PHLH4_20370 [Pseudomonas sp. St316]|nr:hypothetical protein PHLH4_20370 [Pseudomonas sp. St316]
MDCWTAIASKLCSHLNLILILKLRMTGTAIGLLQVNRKHDYSRAVPTARRYAPQAASRPGFFEHYEELIGTWTRRLRNRQQAEDLAHGTFVRVLESVAPG